MLIEEVHSFPFEERCSGLFLVIAETLHSNVLLWILITFFYVTLLITEIAHSHLIICLLPEFHNFSATFVLHFWPVALLQKWNCKNKNVYGPEQIHHFGNNTIAFFASRYPMKINIPSKLALILEIIVHSNINDNLENALHLPITLQWKWV